jgi:hypothetical protein
MAGFGWVAWLLVALGAVSSICGLAATIALYTINENNVHINAEAVLAFYGLGVATGSIWNFVWLWLCITVSHRI